MFYNMPVKVFQEKECVQNHSRELAELGTKALIVTGKHSAKVSGALEDVEKALKAEGRDYVIYDRIEENPSIETVMDAREYGLKQEADSVIGVGGGSPLDASKAIALMMYNRDRGEELLYRNESVKAYKVAAVPTTCGTGSEVTPYSILTIHNKKTKASIPHKIFPEIALIDGKYLQTASKQMIANTAVDALAHMIESYCGGKATDYSRMFCEYGWKIWRKNIDVILGRRKAEEEDYVNLMASAVLAGMAITHTGTSLPHGMSYMFTYAKGLAHGKAVGTFLPAFLERMPQEKQEYILMALGMNSLDEFKQFIKEAVGGIAMDESLVEEAVKNMLKNPGKYAACPCTVTEQLLKEMYRSSLDETI